MEIIKKKWLYILGYIYLMSSVYIFLLGNVKLYISIPISLLITFAFFKAIKNMPDVNNSIYKNYKTLIIIGVIILLWVIFSGVGGFVWQNTWDHKFRNAVFKDLVNMKWPVIQDGYALCYYLGFWLPAAIFGKLFGLTAGYVFQVIWAFIGVFIAFLLMGQYLKKLKIVNLIILIFYSGLDVIMFYMFSKLSILETTKALLTGKHIELILNGFNSSSNTTLLFWLYNQIIPFWIGMMLILMQKNNKALAFTYALMVLYAPFPMVALVPVVIYLAFKNYDDEKTEDKNILVRLWIKLKQACTLENIISLFIVIPIGLFYMSNIAANKIHMLDVNKNVILRYIVYLIFEFVIYLIFVYKTNKKDMILFILLGITMLAPFIQLGNRYDFAYRTCIPLAFYLMLLLMKEFDKLSCKSLKKYGIVIILCIGAITPLTEMIRTLGMESRVILKGIPARSDKLESVFVKEGNECYENFIANTDTIFYKYLAKQSDK